jgi:hypothetical protein
VQETLPWSDQSTALRRVAVVVFVVVVGLKYENEQKSIGNLFNGVRIENKTHAIAHILCLSLQVCTVQCRIFLVEIDGEKIKKCGILQNRFVETQKAKEKERKEREEKRDRVNVRKLAAKCTGVSAFIFSEILLHSEAIDLTCL